MRGMNRVFLMGNVGQDPIIKQTPTGRAVCELSVATHRNVRKGDGWEEEVEWTRIRLWEQRAELAARFLTRGAPIAVEGQLRTETWTDPQNVRHYKTVVLVDQLHLLPRVNGEHGRSVSEPMDRSAGDEIPF